MQRGFKPTTSQIEKVSALNKWGYVTRFCDLIPNDLVPLVNKYLRSIGKEALSNTLEVAHKFTYSWCKFKKQIFMTINLI